MISTASFFFAGHARMALTEGEGVSCAAVLLVRLALPLPVLHPGKREGYYGMNSWTALDDRTGDSRLASVTGDIHRTAIRVSLYL